MKRPVVSIGVCLLLVMAMSAGCDRPPPSLPSPGPGQPVLIFERQGGIAGFQDKLVIGYAGEYYLWRDGRDHIGLLDAERRVQLAGWSDSFVPFVIKLEDNPGGPDNLVHRLEWAALGRLYANQSQQEEILEWAANLLQELSAAGS